MTKSKKQKIDGKVEGSKELAKQEYTQGGNRGHCIKKLKKREIHTGGFFMTVFQVITI